MKVAKYLGAVIAALTVAVFLRFAKDNMAREWITVVLGYEWRAVLEHLLAGFAIPLGLTFAVACGGYWGDRALYALFRPRSYSSMDRLDDYLSGIVVFLCTAFVAVIYVVLEYRFELTQETLTVYGAPPRNYFQWRQFVLGDVLGALLSVLAAYQYAKFDSWRTLLKYMPGNSRRTRAFE